MPKKPLLEIYKTTIQPKLMAELGCTNIHQVPKLDKVVIN
ncbi:MAG: 50S ribosomal protein L5, partial [Cyanobacteria bacterium J06639_1]